MGDQWASKKLMSHCLRLILSAEKKCKWSSKYAQKINKKNDVSGWSWVRRRRKRKPSGLLQTLGRAGDGGNCDGDMTGCIKEIYNKKRPLSQIISRSLDTEAPPGCPGESCPGCPGSHCAKDLSMNRFVFCLWLCVCVFVYEILDGFCCFSAYHLIYLSVLAGRCSQYQVLPRKTLTQHYWYQAEILRRQEPEEGFSFKSLPSSSHHHQH